MFGVSVCVSRVRDSVSISSVWYLVSVFGDWFVWGSCVCMCRVRVRVTVSSVLVLGVCLVIDVCVYVCVCRVEG